MDLVIMGFKLFLLLEKILMLLPNKARKNFFTFLASLAYYLSSRYRNTGFVNLDFIYGDTLSHTQKKEIVKYSFRNLLLNFLHLMELRHISKDELAKKITIKNREIVDNVHAQNRAVIYVTSHYCAWELGGIGIGTFVEPLAAVFRKMKNREYEQWVLESRERFGNSSLEKRNVMRALISLVKKKMASGILIDTAMNQREGIEVDFLGKKVYQTPAPAYLARKYDAAIIPVVMLSKDEESYELVFFDEIVVEKTENEQEDIQKATQLQADWLGSLIYNQPKCWFWIHRRFKGEYPHIYKR
ncbi:MAG: lipid A biosynthesis lauroyl acyltransferase [Sulfurimonas sp.]|uniref:lipid A biosynthesis lauroyl acyltransferase n=1 Tax=Sulfurimonas sp. TaxID=2022749 RepID=UPI00262165F4|nr:lipid A biosynthesis lauroyl acyltransferase [Sulfurimonas sp.]MDD2651756.1 lipid A biosynthesis lauroyl acyltransferase [Sulfurimonas sp.]MDD3451692.1 lipid A biosynthesis lauroyl acyltransferase [Sulfurimonas sp.]